MRNLKPRREVMLFVKIIYEFLMQQSTVSYTFSTKKIKLVINTRNLIERYLKICPQSQTMLFLLSSWGSSESMGLEVNQLNRNCSYRQSTNKTLQLHTGKVLQVRHKKARILVLYPSRISKTLSTSELLRAIPHNE